MFTVCVALSFFSGAWPALPSSKSIPRGSPIAIRSTTAAVAGARSSRRAATSSANRSGAGMGRRVTRSPALNNAPSNALDIIAAPD